jgi:general secretion pathway protein D
MNAVMVVTKNADFLGQTTQWVQRLDRSEASGTTVRTYRLKYGNAAQVTKVLSEIFTSQHSGTDDTPTNQLAPGTTTAQSRLDSLDHGTQLASASDPSSSSPQPTPARWLMSSASMSQHSVTGCTRSSPDGKGCGATWV